MIKLKIYSNQSNEIIFQMNISNELLNEYDINVNNENFTELFETELLSDIMYQNNINSSKVYYSIK
jgi:hypothetical protein